MVGNNAILQVNQLKPFHKLSFCVRTCNHFVKAGVTDLKTAMSKLFLFNENNSGEQGDLLCAPESSMLIFPGHGTISIGKLTPLL